MPQPKNNGEISMNRILRPMCIFLGIIMMITLAPMFGVNADANVDDSTETEVGTNNEANTDNQAGADTDGYFVWPLADTEHNIGSAFGFRRRVGRMHLGIDIMVPVGRPVYAASSGTVRTATRDGAWGVYIIVDHDAPFQGLSTAYAHLDRLGEGIRPGVHVQRGQQIATSGRSGNASAPHLHFELRVNNIMVNPLPQFHRDESRVSVNPNPLFFNSGGRMVFNPNFDPTFSEHEFSRLSQGRNFYLLPAEGGDFVAPPYVPGESPPQNGQTTTPAVSEALGASSWAAAEVDEAILLGLIPEILLTDFQTNITRAEFCQTVVQALLIIAGMDEEPDEVIEDLYADVDEMNPFDDTDDIYISIAFHWGIVNGIGDRRFAPENTITRQEAAAMLSRVADIFDITGLFESPVVFEDAGLFAAWAVRPVGFVSASGIMGGVGDGRFAPLDGYTREQTFVTMIRLSDVISFAEYQREYGN